MTMAMKIKEREEVVVLADRISSISELRTDTSNERMMKVFHLEKEQLNEILSLLDKYPNKDEWELAEMILYK